MGRAEKTNSSIDVTEHAFVFLTGAEKALELFEIDRLMKAVGGRFIGGAYVV